MSLDTPDPMRRVLRWVAGITAASGALQMSRPRLILGELSPDHSAMTRQLFGTVGMFMAVAGGILHRTLAVEDPDRGLLGWAALQKIGAAAAVALGVRHRLFARRALAVAVFDFCSGIACLVFARRPAAVVTDGR
jgi:hypothetical protein